MWRRLQVKVNIHRGLKKLAALIEKLEEAEGVWEYFKETFSESDATILEALMNQDATDSQGNQKVLDEALKSLK